MGACCGCLCSTIDLLNAATVNSVGNLSLMLWFVLLFGGSVIWCLSLTFPLVVFCGVWFVVLWWRCGCLFCKVCCFCVSWHLIVVLPCLLLGLCLLCLW